MKRLGEDTLHRWLTARRRKPLVLRGARQVGKTTLVRRFAAAAGMALCEVNLERHLYLDRVFESLDTGRILRELEMLGGTRLDRAILFLDEVQATPHALPATCTRTDRICRWWRRGRCSSSPSPSTDSPCRWGAFNTCIWDR